MNNKNCKDLFIFFCKNRIFSQNLKFDEKEKEEEREQVCAPTVPLAVILEPF
jgi:hypothetical protein